MKRGTFPDGRARGGAGQGLQRGQGNKVLLPPDLLRLFRWVLAVTVVFHGENESKHKLWLVARVI